jgi:hypothetical protein
MEAVFQADLCVIVLPGNFSITISTSPACGISISTDESRGLITDVDPT